MRLKRYDDEFDWGGDEEPPIFGAFPWTVFWLTVAFFLAIIALFG